MRYSDIYGKKEKVISIYTFMRLPQCPSMYFLYNWVRKNIPPPHITSGLKIWFWDLGFEKKEYFRKSDKRLILPPTTFHMKRGQRQRQPWWVSFAGIFPYWSTLFPQHFWPKPKPYICSIWGAAQTPGFRRILVSPLLRLFRFVTLGSERLERRLYWLLERHLLPLNLLILTITGCTNCTVRSCTILNIPVLFQIQKD